MSTRCQIDIIDENESIVKIYHHFDGYFSRVGAELRRLLQRKRLLSNSNDFIHALLKDKGYEITENNHGDIEYYYKLDFMRKKFLGWQTNFFPKVEIVEESVIDLTSNDNRFFKK